MKHAWIALAGMVAWGQVLDPNQPLLEVQVYTAAKVPPMPSFSSAREWEQYATRLRARILNEIVLRGEAKRWAAEAGLKTEILDPFAEGPGYRVRHFRFEAIRGLWVPGVIYEPVPLTGRVPVVLNVNGHEGIGTATPYIQERCISLARKGLIAVNPEWLGKGQLNTDGFNHNRMPQLDLVGTSGVGLFYLSLKRSVDIAASLPHADPKRLAVTGLSGGGWQTIFISSLDTRVAVANPVAGYSSYLTRAQWPDLDLGDSEQTPSDLASIADYTHLTALMAPRGLQLAYNAKDNCCFRADYAIGPLMQAATPVYALYRANDKLRYHVNHGAGHNYDQDNRESFYRLVLDQFGLSFDPAEQPAGQEVRTAEALRPELPADNLDFRQVARHLAEGLPRNPNPTVRELEKIVRTRKLSVEAVKVGTSDWKLNMDRAWTVPATEYGSGTSAGAVMLVGDTGRAQLADQARALAAEGRRVIAVDPFYFGESKIAKRDYLFAMLVAGLGERPLGVQASQLASVARWMGTAEIRAVGPRTSLAALIAAAIEPRAITGVRLKGALTSLHQILEQDFTVDKTPELFCFGLLEKFDVAQIEGLIKPREVVRD